MAVDWDENTPITSQNLNAISPQNSVYPVGSIYINASDSTNPATLLGFGTWERFGEGRVLVSQDSTDSDFDGIGETGGKKTDNSVSHNHGYFDRSANNQQEYSDVSRTTQSTSTFSDSNNLQPYITVYMWVRTA